MSRGRQRRQARRLGGFTMVEATMALAILFIGILGMGALAGASVRSNMDANEMTMAANLADRVVGRLRTEALGWNLVSWNPAVDVAAPAVQMPLLVSGISTDPAATFLEVNNAMIDDDSEFRAFNRNLEQVAVDSASAKFCVHYRLVWLEQNESMRADVRVYWLRPGVSPTTYGFGVEDGDCGQGQAENMAADITQVRCVARSVVLTRNVLEAQ